jgi:AcrR family transcriptional regulator
MEHPTPRTGGRSARVTAAVRAAAIAALLEDGYAGMRMEDVADRAGVHKTTIYRRWGSRERLLADALAASSGQQVAIPDTGDVRTDLVTLALRVRDAVVAPSTRALMTALAAAAHHPELETVGRRFWSERLAAATPVVERAVERGELPAGVDADDLIIRVVGPIWFAVFGPQRTPDDAFVARTVDVVLAGSRSTAGDR